MKNKKHGGKRKGSGRKKKEPTKTVRLTISELAEIKEKRKQKKS